MDSKGDHALLSFQKDRWNTVDEGRFTGNVAFYSRDEWERARAMETWLPAKPAATSTYPGVGWQMRIGHFLVPSHDHWWTIRAPDDVPAITAEVLTVVLQSALPQLRARLSGEVPPKLPEL